MPSQPKTKTISFRISAQQHHAVTRLAMRQNQSVSRLIADIIAKQMRQQEEQDLYDAFTVLGRIKEADVKFALAAQAQVASGE
jgi:predicted DNA-binding protein